MNRSNWRKSPGLALALAIGVGLSFVLLAWFGVSAAQEWQRSSTLLVQRRADEAASLLVTALTRDMRAAHTTVLSSTVWDSYNFDAPFEVMSTVASAFARYPYPECFFAWRGDAPSRTTIFARANRQLPWAPLAQDLSRYPVRLEQNDRFAASLQAGSSPPASHKAMSSRWMSSPLRAWSIRWLLASAIRIVSVSGSTQSLGFVVNVGGREFYFADFAREISRIGGDDTGLALGLFDARHQPVAMTRPFVDEGLVSRRPFAFAFYDTAATPLDMVSPTRRGHPGG